MKIAQVFVEHPIMHLDHTFTYMQICFFQCDIVPI